MGFLDSLKKLFGGGDSAPQETAAPQEQPMADQGMDAASEAPQETTPEAPAGGTDEEERTQGGM